LKGRAKASTRIAGFFLFFRLAQVDELAKEVARTTTDRLFLSRAASGDLL